MLIFCSLSAPDFPVASAWSSRYLMMYELHVRTPLSVNEIEGLSESAIPSVRNIRNSNEGNPDHGKKKT
jgi:hypothetical protein